MNENISQVVEDIISKKLNVVQDLLKRSDMTELKSVLLLIEYDINNYIRGDYTINWNQLECDIAKVLYPSFIKQTDGAKKTVKYAKELIEELKKDINKSE